jgi:hypothetical protein
MKKLLLLFFILPLFSYSQSGTKAKDATVEQVKAAYAALPKVEGQYEFSEVVQLDSSFKKDGLYRNAKLFFANAFKSAKDVLQYDDREEGKTVGKGNVQSIESQAAFLNYFTETWVVNFTLEIHCKDGKYKYRIYDISIDARMESSPGDHVSHSTYTLDEAYDATGKGITKKMDRNLFMDAVKDIQGLTNQIKDAMNKKSSKDDF